FPRRSLLNQFFTAAGKPKAYRYVRRQSRKAYSCFFRSHLLKIFQLLSVITVLCCHVIRFPKTFSPEAFPNEEVRPWSSRLAFTGADGAHGPGPERRTKTLGATRAECHHHA